MAEWFEQWKRVVRWHGRVQAIYAGKHPLLFVQDGVVTSEAVPASGAHEADDVFAFFQNCHHLKDWLIHDNLATRGEVEAFRRSRPELLICGDLCNVTEHSKLTPKPWRKDTDLRTSQNATVSMGRGVFHSWEVVSGGNRKDALELATECMDAWKEFLVRKGLLSN